MKLNVYTSISLALATASTAFAATTECYDFQGLPAAATLSNQQFGSFATGQSNDRLAGTPLTLSGGSTIDIDFTAIMWDEYDNSTYTTDLIHNFGIGTDNSNFVGVSINLDGTGIVEVVALSVEGGVVASSNSLGTFSLPGADRTDAGNLDFGISLSGVGNNFTLDYDISAANGFVTGADLVGSTTLSNNSFTSTDDLTAFERGYSNRTTVTALYADGSGGISTETVDTGVHFSALGGEGTIGGVCNHVVPEPSSGLLGLIAAAGFLARRRR